MFAVVFLLWRAFSLGACCSLLLVCADSVFVRATLLQLIGASFQLACFLSWRVSAGVFICWRVDLLGLFAGLLFSAGAFSLPI